MMTIAGKALRTLAATAVVGMLAAGCGKRDDGATGGVAKPGVTIGFVVKQPEEPWFQLEWKFAREAAEKYGFRLIEIGAPDGEKVLAAIDTLTAAGASGLIVCTPDVKLGPAILNKSRAAGLKLLAVDDRFVGSDGNYMEDVVYLGISARKIGNEVGKTLFEQMQARGWKPEETGCCVVTFKELDTARERTEGATETLLAAGFPKERIFEAAQKTSDIPGAFDAVSVLLTKQPDIKRWLVCGMNDSAVLGAIRAMEQGGRFGADTIIGVGINGTDCIGEFKKAEPTGFHGSMLLSAKQHGYRTAEMMYRWITDGEEPPKDTRTTGVLITRENFRDVLAEQGIPIP